MTLDIVNRTAWGARPATARTTMRTPSPELWLHHSAGSERGAKGMRTIQNYHMDAKGWTDIAYSFVIDPDALTVYEGRGAGIVGGHTKDRNSISHAICVMGNFENEQASPGLLRLIADLTRHGREQGWWGDLTGGHRDAPRASTACPGQHLYGHIAEIRSLSHATVSVPQEDDMTPEQSAKLDAIEMRLVELDDDIPENLGDILKELRLNLRTIAEKVGVPAADIER